MRGKNGTKFEGVTWHEEDRDGGPFMVRIGGTREFVSIIDPDCNRSWPRGSVKTVDGWDNPLAMKYNSLDEAKDAGASVWEIEGFHNSVEAIGWMNS
jgi:hypothetical protein